MKIVRMVTAYGNNPVSEKRKMEALYEAAGSVFALPAYEQILDYLNGGSVPEPPYCVENTPGGNYAIGKMIDADGVPSVMIRTDGGREIVIERNRVAVNFRTGLRNASSEAARRVLLHLHLHTSDQICFLETEDGRIISDADIAPEEITPEEVEK